MRNENDDLRLPERLPEAEAKRILDRAMEIDHIQGPLMSMANLRNIAQELGISEDALQKALSENFGSAAGASQLDLGRASAGSGERPDGWLDWFRRTWSRKVRFLSKIALASGICLGIFVTYFAERSMMGSREGILFFAAAAAVFTALIARARKPSTAVQMITPTVLFFGGLAGGAFIFANGREPQAIAELSALFLLVSIGVGVILSALGGFLRRIDSGEGPKSGGGHPDGHVEVSSSGEGEEPRTVNQLAVVAD